MSDDHPSSNDNPGPKKGFFTLLLNQLFHGEPKSRDELVELIRDSEQNDLIDPDTRDMLEGVMDISDQRVRDIMIPRSQIVTLKRNQTLDECLDVIIDSAHSRFPVISEDKDHIEGILMAKDLLPFMRTDAPPFSIDKVLRQAVVVPESKRVDRMLKEFRSQRYHMAIVIDEFGGVSGLVTIEDILELIVGEIEDEYDEEEDVDIRSLSRHTYTVRALTQIEDFNEPLAPNSVMKKWILLAVWLCRHSVIYQPEGSPLISMVISLKLLWPIAEELFRFMLRYRMMRQYLTSKKNKI